MRGVKQVINKEKRVKALLKRSFNQISKESISKIGSIEKRPFISLLQKVICNFYQKYDHFKVDCSVANGLYLACEFVEYTLTNCPKKWIIGEVS